MYKKSLYIFRRDLRITDNRSLAECLDKSESVIPLFVFSDKQIDPKNNDYFSPRSFAFLIECLDDLSDQFDNQSGQLFFARDNLENVINQAKTEHNIDAVFVARDYTPFSRKRDEHLEKICSRLDLEFNSCNDLLLNEPEEIKTGSGGPYKVFTPFRNKSQENPVVEPCKVIGTQKWQKTSSFNTGWTHLVDKPESSTEFAGGRATALQKKKIIDDLGNYKEDRDYPAKRGTTMLSPHLKFGTISPREFYYWVENKHGAMHGLINELYWRDFYAHLTFHFPHVLDGKSFKPQYDKIEWENDKQKFQAWCDGKTGYPIVDAGMRQLNETGWMHNRVRMIAASFLTKDLHVDWRWGEKYFAQSLVDYDPMTNNGSWQWAASTGADAQPYFRIFNPRRQQEKFDKDCEYIKKWIPELAELDAKSIHKLGETPLLVPDSYVQPIVDHRERAAKAKEMFKEI